MSGPILEAYVKWERCVQEVMDSTARFPKVLRAALGLRIDQVSIDVLVRLSEIRFLPPDQKGPLLKCADRDLATLRVLLRLARQREALGLKRFRFLSEMIDEVGRMIGGLRRISGGSKASGGSEG